MDTSDPLFVPTEPTAVHASYHVRTSVGRDGNAYGVRAAEVAVLPSSRSSVCPPVRFRVPTTPPCGSVDNVSKNVFLDVCRQRGHRDGRTEREQNDPVRRPVDKLQYVPTSNTRTGHIRVVRVSRPWTVYDTRVPCVTGSPPYLCARANRPRHLIVRAR